MADKLPKSLALDSQLCFSLYGASMAMTRVYKPLLDRLGITYPQYLVINTLWEEDGRTIGAGTRGPITTRIQKAFFECVNGKCFDQGVLCSAENSLICDAPVDAQVKAELPKHGAFIVYIYTCIHFSS